jgi:hypothetical protein
MEEDAGGRGSDERQIIWFIHLIYLIRYLLGTCCILRKKQSLWCEWRRKTNN